MAKYSVGDTVLLIHYRLEPEEVTITRVGRKIAYITLYGREVGFYMETGKQAGNRGDWRICTREDYDNRNRLAAAQDKLRKQGIVLDVRASLALRRNVDKLERIIAIVEE